MGEGGMGLGGLNHVQLVWFGFFLKVFEGLLTPRRAGLC